MHAYIIIHFYQCWGNVYMYMLYYIFNWQRPDNACNDVEKKFKT